MYLITNRAVHDSDGKKTGLEIFGEEPNPLGAHELRLARVDKDGGVELLQDALEKAEVEALKQEFSLSIDTTKTWYASLRVACDVFREARASGRQVLLYVHGYNNDIYDVVNTVRDLEENYKVVVVAFSWPANGGNPVSGGLSYLSDKEDARNSATALNRVVSRLNAYHGMLVEDIKRQCEEKALARYPGNRERARGHYAHLLLKQCTVRISLLCHSMGNYVLKYATLPGASALRQPVFDNVNMVAADVNNPGHADWVEAIAVRHRLFVVINENDEPLGLSRSKPGEEQLERLGHHLRNLNAGNAYYVDVTRNAHVKGDHSYFKSDVVGKNATLKRLFARMFEGAAAESMLDFHTDLNVYRS